MSLADVLMKAYALLSINDEVCLIIIEDNLISLIGQEPQSVNGSSITYSQREDDFSFVQQEVQDEEIREEVFVVEEEELAEGEAEAGGTVVEDEDVIQTDVIENEERMVVTVKK